MLEHTDDSLLRLRRSGPGRVFAMAVAVIPFWIMACNRQQPSKTPAHGPVIVVVDPERDLGEIASKRSATTFEIANGGDSALRIERIEKSCGCA